MDSIFKFLGFVGAALAPTSPTSPLSHEGRRQRRPYLLAALLAGMAAASAPAADTKPLLNVSYDVTREFYKEYNPLFLAHWQKTTGQVLTVNQSHGGSSKQIRSVVDGLPADVVTMNGVPDVDQLAKVCVVSRKLYEELWGDEPPEGKVLRTLGMSFAVVGEFEEPVDTLGQGDVRPRTILVPMVVK